MPIFFILFNLYFMLFMTVEDFYKSITLAFLNGILMNHLLSLSRFKEIVYDVYGLATLYKHDGRPEK